LPFEADKIFTSRGGRSLPNCPEKQLLAANKQAGGQRGESKHARNAGKDHNQPNGPILAALDNLKV
jgi:hypothetical protein